MREPRPFTLKLTKEEFEALKPPVGGGGHQILQRQLIEKTEQHGEDFIVTIDDEDLGRLVRHMTQYKHGGFQGRLRKAFLRSLLEVLCHGHVIWPKE